MHYYSVWVLFLVLTRYRVRAQQLDLPASDFNRHSIVQPVVHHGRTKREITTTRNTNGAHHQEVTMTVNVDGEEYKLDLRLNHDLVAGDHAIRYQKNGKTVTHKPNKEEIDFCHYSGVVRDRAGSWVAVSTCRGVRGVIFDGHHMRYIEPANTQSNINDIQSKHYLYSHSDLNTIHKCGHTGATNDTTHKTERDSDNSWNRKDMENIGVNRYKRSIEESQVRAPYNSNKLSRYVELVLVADHGEYVANGRDLRTTHSMLIQLANIVNSLYSPLNIFIALVSVEVWTEGDRIPLSEDHHKILADFHQYRAEMIRDGLRHDNAHLLTRQKFMGDAVGLASVGGICRDSFSGGIAHHHSKVIGLVASTVAHEMGHNFGMHHDTVHCNCPDRMCIMTATIIVDGTAPVRWSSCSRKELADTFKQGLDFCLHNKPKSLYESPNCGNGFVEVGEQCDCGLSESTACRACCDADTCMLRRNATCGAGACCDFTTCRPKSAGVVCRSADKECDLPEYCTGHSEYCPDDVYKMNSLPCGNGDDQAYCMEGSCRSHNDQCRLLFGPSGSSNPKCYQRIQSQEDSRMDCGRDSSGRPICDWSGDHAMCARISCTHPKVQNRYPEINYHLKERGTVVSCPVPVDMGPSNQKFGLVPDGAKCGVNKMCMKQRCVSLESARKEIYKTESSVCPSNCSGNGVCNSLGRCNCEPGYLPPRCDVLRQNNHGNRRMNDHDTRRQNDPDNRRRDDPDNRRGNDPDNRRRDDPSNRRQNDPDNRRRDDPDNRRRDDPDNRRRDDPDNRKRDDPSNRRQNDPDKRRRDDPSDRRQNDPDNRRRDDPDNRRGNDPDNRRRDDPSNRRQNDPDNRRRDDPDNRRRDDPDNRRRDDPDNRKRDDPSNRRQNDPDKRRRDDPSDRRQNDPDNRRRDDPPTNRRQNDPDNRKGNDPSNRRQNDPDNRRRDDPENRRQNDPDNRRGNDPSNRRQNDSDNRRRDDPDNRRRDDPSNRRQNDLDNRRGNDPDNRRRDDPSNRRHNDPDNRRGNDLDNRRRNDPDNRRGNDPDNRRGNYPENRRGNDLDNRRGNDLDNRRGNDFDNRKGNDPFDTIRYNYVNPSWNKPMTPRKKSPVNSSWSDPADPTRRDPTRNDTVSPETDRIEDSKPDDDLNAQRNLKIALFVIFLGVLPAGIIAFLVFYYSRHEAPRWWKKPQSPLLKGLLFKNFKIPNIFNGYSKSTNAEQMQKSTDVLNGDIETVKTSNKAVADMNVTETVKKITKNDIQIVCGADIPPPVNFKPYVNPLDNYLPIDTSIPFNNSQQLLNLVKPKPLEKPMLIDKPKPFIHLKPIAKPEPFENPMPIDKPKPFVHLKPIAKPELYEKPMPIDETKPFVHLKPVVKPKPFDKPNKPMDNPQLSAKPKPLGQSNPLDNHKPVNPKTGVCLASITNDMLSKHRLRSVGDNGYKKL